MYGLAIGGLYEGSVASPVKMQMRNDDLPSLDNLTQFWEDFYNALQNISNHTTTTTTTEAPDVSEIAEDIQNQIQNIINQIKKQLENIAFG